MARRREFDPREAADRALIAFGEYGFDRTSIADLVAATGILAGSLHAAFGSKEGLFAAGLERYEQVLFEALETRASGLQGLMHIFRQVVRMSAKDGAAYRGCPIVTSMGVQRHLSEPTLAHMDRITMRIRSLLEMHVRAGQDSREIRPEVPPRDAAASLLATLVGIRAMGIAGARRSELAAMVRGALRPLELERRR